MTMKIILTENRIRGGLEIYAQAEGVGAMDLIGAYTQNEAGDWTAETWDGQTFLEASKADLHGKITSHVDDVATHDATSPARQALFSWGSPLYLPS